MDFETLSQEEIETIFGWYEHRGKAVFIGFHDEKLR
jgi:hypothetical protein